MNLPNYFIADLPSDASITSSLVTDACETIRRNGERYLTFRSTQDIIALLDRLGRDWMSSSYPFRQLALQQGPAATGFSEQILSIGLDNFFRRLTTENLEALVQQELGDQQRLDRFTPDQPNRNSLALGPRLLVHLASRPVPCPTLANMIFGMLVRSAQFVRCAPGQDFIPRLFAHSIYEAEPKLGACLEVAAWKTDSEELNSTLLSHAHCVTANGNEQALVSIRSRLPHKTRFLGSTDRVSFGYITKEILSSPFPAQVAAQAAQDVVAWDQQGPLSPHLIYVENGGNTSPEAFAELLSAELQAFEATHPRGTLGPQQTAAIATRRSFYEVRAAHSLDTKMWASDKTTAWTVVFENDPQFQTSCLNRFIYVKAVANVEEALHAAELVRESVSTVGLASVGVQAQLLATRFARWGVSRICPLGQMQTPPLSSRTDGRPALGDLVIWSEWEK